MKFTQSLLSCLSVGACCAAASAQDSVSKIHNPVTGGDSIDAHAIGEQRNDYVVDQTIVRSSWGTVFGIAPLVKASRQRLTGATNYNALVNAQFLSRDLRTVTAFASPSYALWTVSGAGVCDDPARNDPPGSVNAVGLAGFQFGTCFGEFSTGGSVTPAPSQNQIISAIVNFTNGRPSRLHVARIVAAVNSPTEACSLGSMHMGSIDANGAAYFRNDGFGGGDCVTSTPTYLRVPAAVSMMSQHNNVYRINSLLRTTSMVNVISGTGADDVGASERLVNDSFFSFNTPNNVPTSIAGRPLYVGLSFNKDYLFEGSAGVITSTLTHRAATVVDQRGASGYAPIGYSFLGATAVGTCGVLGKETLGSSEGAFTVNIWGIDANGADTGARALKLPPTEPVPVAIVDPDQPSWSSSNIAGPMEYDHYHDQTGFQGGNSQVAIGRDQAGNLIVAATVYYGLTPGTPPAIGAHLGTPNQFIAVTRIDPTGTLTEWSVAAWTQETTTPLFSDGKTIYQNNVTPIGRLTGALFGPAISAPMIDSVGNIWFVGEIELAGAPPTTANALLRAVYDAATFSYRLELVTKVGDIFPGRNSATPYKIRSLELKDSNSISSGSAWSGNVSPWAFKGQSTIGMSTSDAATLGALVLHANIIYDVDGNGLYEVGSGTTPPVPGSPDEDYDVLLYLSPAVDANANDIPDDGEVPGTEFCSNGTLGLDHTTACPCGNTGFPENGCAHSFSATGAHIGATGQVATDTVVLHSQLEPVTSFTLFMQHANSADTVFHDGVLCAGNPLIRLRGRGAVAGEAFFPNSNFAQDSTTTLSIRGGVTIGSGVRRYYAAWYRNASSTYCPPATANVTNGYFIDW